VLFFASASQRVLVPGSEHSAPGSAPEGLLVSQQLVFLVQ